MPKDHCEMCGFKPKDPRSVFYSAMFEVTRCVNGVACLNRMERARKKADIDALRAEVRLKEAKADA